MSIWELRATELVGAGGDLFMVSHGVRRKIESEVAKYVGTCRRKADRSSTTNITCAPYFEKGLM